MKTLKVIGRSLWRAFKQIGKEFGKVLQTRVARFPVWVWAAVILLAGIFRQQIAAIALAAITPVALLIAILVLLCQVKLALKLGGIVMIVMTIALLLQSV